MNYLNIRNNAKQFLSLTSMSVEDFDDLLPLFSFHWDRFIHKFTLAGKPRKKSYVAKSLTGLNSIDEKLFFILVYEKNNPLQEYHAASFGLTQDMTNKWIHLLAPILSKALEKYKPARTAQELETKIIENNTYIGDCTERPIERPTNNQEAVYSGKKKAHTLKNFLLCCTCGFVVFLGATVSGKTFDKKVAEEQLSLNKPIDLLADLGFQGLKLCNVNVKLPHKKPKGKELTKIQKKENQLFNSERVLIENVLSHVKIMRIVKDKNRNRKEGFRDLVIDTAVRIHNYRVTKRQVVLLPMSFHES